MTKEELNSAQPTNVRFAVVAVSTLMSVLLYLDRFCTSFAEIFIKEDLGLSDTQIGYMMSAFFFSYALAQVPSGWFSDRFGVRPMLTIYILAWSALTALTGFVQELSWLSGFAMLIIVRLGFGIAQAGAYPTGAALLSKWVPMGSRGKASSCVALGGRIGGALAPVLTAYCIVAFVPPAVDSRLEGSDLLDAHSLAEQIQDSNTAATSAWVAHTDGQLTQAFANSSILGEIANSTSGGVSNSLRQQAVAVINEKVISGGDLYDREAFVGAPLDDEAKRIAARPPNERSEIQQRRLNRLIIEKVYPVSIRKIYGKGWRSVMFTYGAAGIIVAALFWFILRNRPQDHPRVNDAEVALIEADRPPDAPSAHGKVDHIPILNLLTSTSMWLVCVSQFCTNIGWVFIVTWLPRYLDSVHQVPVQTRGWMASIPLFVGWGGMVAGGFVTDRLIRVVGLRWGRSLPMALSRFTAMAAYLYCVFLEPSAWMAVAAFGLVAFSTDLGTAPVWAFKQDVGGRYVGSILGWGNMWGNLGATLTPTLLIWIVGDTKNWDAAFLTCAGAFLLAGVASLGVDATKPIAPPDEPEGLK